jgi:glutaredoxin 3
MAKVEIYTRDWCGYCARAKNLLSGRGVEFTEYPIDGDAEAQAAMIARAAGRTSVPQIFIDDRHIGGCDDLVALDSAGELDTLLAP